VQLGTFEYPRRSQLDAVLQEHAGRTVSSVVLRDGLREPVELAVTRDGKLGIMLDLADDLLVTADPVTTYARYAPDDPMTIEDVSTPLAGLDVMAGSIIRDVDGETVTGWGDMRRALRAATAAAREAGSAAEVTIGLVLPTPGRTYETVTVPLSATDVADLHALAWSIPVRSYLFEPVYTVRSAGGNPFMALAMGFEETHKMVLRTYLTIDRLFRGSVGVEQLRGPVGIVHLGSSIADKGFMYLLFFLAMISVNLAVLNFLPMPIVDGGLFLFLIYEKLKGRPPSIAFQNVATIIGLCLIGALFLVVTWNDVLRLFA
jgi:regulator of sigma E protease